MGDSEGLVDQEALESSITNEEVSDVQEEKPNSEINEEGNNESNEPQESGVAGEEEKGEAQEETIADDEVEEQPQNPNQGVRSQSLVKRQQSVSQRSPSSTDHRTSSQVKSHMPLTNVVSVSDGRTMIKPVEQQNTTEEDAVRVSQKTGKKIRDSTIQTSLIWEKKPLSQILPQSRKQAPCPDSTRKPEDQNSFFNWPDPFEF